MQVKIQWVKVGFSLYLSAYETASPVEFLDGSGCGKKPTGTGPGEKGGQLCPRMSLDLSSLLVGPDNPRLDFASLCAS